MVPEADGKKNPDSSARTDEQGYFTLKPEGNDWTGQDGAVVGDHFVQISKYERELDKTNRPRGELVPAKYNSKMTLRFTVPAEGTKEANFLDLKSQ
jgi:hypothetical protein